MVTNAKKTGAKKSRLSAFLVIGLIIFIGIIGAVWGFSSIKEEDTDNTACSSVHPVSAWKSGNYVDKFGDKTTQKYIMTETIGTFSNPATNGSFLKVEVVIDKEYTRFDMHGYGPNQPVEKFIGIGEFSMKNSAGEEISGTLWKSVSISTSNGDRSNAMAFLKKSSGEVKIAICDNRHSNYNFSIDTTGFQEEYSKLFAQRED